MRKCLFGITFRHFLPYSVASVSWEDCCWPESPAALPCSIRGGLANAVVDADRRLATP